MIDRTPSESRVEMTQLVLPGDANGLGNAFGGRLMQWVDIAAGVASRRHCGRPAVTASIDSLEFEQPVKLNDVVVLLACVNRAWRTSMEVGVKVICESARDNQQRQAARAYLTFVAIDAGGQPTAVPALRPATADDQRRFDKAQARREQRLKERRSRRP